MVDFKIVWFSCGRYAFWSRFKTAQQGVSFYQDTSNLSS